MKTISEIYKQEGAPFLNRLHQEMGVSRKYLYHLAVGLRRPSPEMALRLVRADNRLDFTRLLLPDLALDQLVGSTIPRPDVGSDGAADAPTQSNGEEVEG